MEQFYSCAKRIVICPVVVYDPSDEAIQRGLRALRPRVPPGP